MVSHEPGILTRASGVRPSRVEDTSRASHLRAGTDRLARGGAGDHGVSQRHAPLMSDDECPRARCVGISRRSSGYTRHLSSQRCPMSAAQPAAKLVIPRETATLTRPTQWMQGICAARVRWLVAESRKWMQRAPLSSKPCPKCHRSLEEHMAAWSAALASWRESGPRCT